MRGGTFRKVFFLSFKLGLVFHHQKLTEEVAFVFFIKNILSWNCNIFLSGGAFRKNHNNLFKTVFDVFPPATCWRVFFLCAFNKREVFAAEENSDFYFHESFRWIFSSFSFWRYSVNRNSIIIISEGYHYVINLGIVSKFYISIDPLYPGSLPKDLP